ncbi:MAG TPA: alpha/beta fold hydrolase [Solirubrobacteraceae bacterium]|nr:alpha/beta fold hydrolase [Solirubrobacteraceae bacterium]
MAYTEYGFGTRTVVLIHGLLLSQRMHEPLARALAARGNHVLTIDLLGHGRSDRPAEPARYSTSLFAAQVVALLDHLAIDESVVLGTSLGANTALEVCHHAPDRVRGMIVEMPVLDQALIACLVAFGPLLIALSVAQPVARLVALAARAIPRRGLPFYADIALETVRQDPRPSGAVLRGLFFGRTAPPEDERRAMLAPTLVIGHRRDPIHPLTDAGMLADELPNGRLLQANSFVELRLTPDRLTDEIAAFLDLCWKPARRTGRSAGAAAAS